MSGELAGAPPDPLAEGAGSVSPPDPATPRRPRQRPLPARVRPSEAAARRRDTREGLAWLGHPPQVKASPLVRAFALLGRFLAFGVFRFQARIDGREHIPERGGYIVVGAAHRGWMDPLLIVHALPLAPRVWFLGGAAAAFSARWKETLLRRLGGILPVWRGGIGIDGHVAAARAVLDQGGVFAQMPEGTVSGPAGKVGTFRLGASLIILRSGVPVLPIAIAGTEELYVGKRMAARILPPATVAELLGEGWDGVMPSPDTRAELDLARRVSDALQARLAPVVEELQPWTVDPPEHPRRLGDRLTWLLLARGPLDRGEGGQPRAADPRAADQDVAGSGPAAPTDPPGPPAGG